MKKKMNLLFSLLLISVFVLAACTVEDGAVGDQYHYTTVLKDADIDGEANTVEVDGETRYFEKFTPPDNAKKVRHVAVNMVVVDDFGNLVCEIQISLGGVIYYWEENGSTYVATLEGGWCHGRVDKTLFDIHP